MDIPAAITNLVEPNKYANLDWKKLPPGSAKPMSSELKAEIARRDAYIASMQAQYDDETKADLEFYSPKSETNAMFLTNVATLPEAELQPRIDYVTRLIQSGESEKYSFQSGNGEQTTTSIHQYLYWLQQRFQSLNSDGTYSPAMFK